MLVMSFDFCGRPKRPLIFYISGLLRSLETEEISFDFGPLETSSFGASLKLPRNLICGHVRLIFRGS